MNEHVERAARARLWLGRARFFAAYAVLALFAFAPSARAAESVCAEVKIEIRQTVTLERQAFDAVLKVRNGLALPVEALDVELRFADADGVAVPATTNPDDTAAKFFFRADGATGIAGALDGSGVVAPASNGEAHWLIVPTASAGGLTADGIAYRVGATITYRMGTETKTVEVTPDTITVKPQPKLRLDYFLTRDVYGDDPLTPQPEPLVPFTLGVRVWNYGYGRANAVAIESGQPQIRKDGNPQGLLVDFRILDSYVDDAPAQPTLTPVFGAIAAGTAKMGRWNMTASLSGIFFNFAATIRHADEFGGALTSLIAPGDINAHDLIHDVLADAPGRDAVRDFLALDGDIVRLYESDGGLVAGGAGALDVVEASGTLSGSSNTRELTIAAASSAFVYAKFADPFAGQLDAIAARRSDGKNLPPANVWFSKERDASGEQWLYFINVFDFHDAQIGAGGQVRYTLTTGEMPPATSSIEGRVYEDVDGDGVRDAGEPAMLDVAATLTGTDGAGGTTTRATRSDALGGFAFAALPAGTYRVAIGEAQGYRDGMHAAGTAGGAVGAHDIADIALGAGVAASGYAFAKTRGVEPPASADLVLADIAVYRSGLIAVNAAFSAVVHVRNDGPGETSATARIALPADFTLMNATPMAGSFDAATKTWNVGLLRAGATQTLALTLLPTQTGARTIGATVAIDGTATDPQPVNNLREFALTVRAQAPLSLEATVDHSPRVLVFAACAAADPPPGGGGESKRHSAKVACSENRVAGFGAMFTALGVEHKVVATEAELVAELRGGRWNTYWISAGTAHALGVETVREIAQAPLRDEWLIVDQPRGNVVGPVDGASRLESYLPAQFTGGDGMEHNTRTVVVPASRWLPAGTLTVHGEFAPYSAPGADAETLGHLDVPIAPVAIQRVNRTLLFGFDLYAALADNPAYRTALLQQLLRETRPQFADVLAIGEAFGVNLAASSHERAATVAMMLALPTGFDFTTSAPPADTSTWGSLLWTAPLGAADTYRARAGLIAPPVGVSARFFATARSVDPAIDDEVQSGDVAVETRTLEVQAGRVRAQLQQLPAAQSQPLVALFDQAAADHAAGRIGAALIKLLDVSDALDDSWRANGVSASATGALAVEVGLLSRWWQREWVPATQQRCADSAGASTACTTPER